MDDNECTRKKTTIKSDEKGNQKNIMKTTFVNLYYVPFLLFFAAVFPLSSVYGEPIDDHEKAIKAVNEGEILPLDEILVKVNQEYAGRIISINLKDNEKGLFGWVYDIMIIEPGNKVKQLRVDAGTSTILSVKTGGK